MTSSGRRHDSSIGIPARTSRYSGSERPACRMNQTGVCGTGSRRQARTNGESAGPPRAGWSSRAALPAVVVLIGAIVPRAPIPATRTAGFCGVPDVPLRGSVGPTAVRVYRADRAG
ncbi:hypothetical protein GCM10022225_01080 [Plantactinospora mayteni]|uniref:Uncharacterized protein n=1 Tax=Plantactinospora mayteni TaxID=566021 RepID=A0ABQ4EYH4_9ACTN|nr:hypothetical protein Pma05_62370 [Plantactinospora mayteni]